MLLHSTLKTPHFLTGIQLQNDFTLFLIHSYALHLDPRLKYKRKPSIPPPFSYLQGTSYFPYICWLTARGQFLPLIFCSLIFPPHLLKKPNTYTLSYIVPPSWAGLSRNLWKTAEIFHHCHLNVSLKVPFPMMACYSSACSLARHSIEHKALDQQPSALW